MDGLTLRCEIQHANAHILNMFLNCCIRKCPHCNNIDTLYNSAPFGTVFSSQCAYSAIPKKGQKAAILTHHVWKKSLQVMIAHLRYKEKVFALM